MNHTPTAHARAPEVILLPAERFFVRVVPLAPDAPAATQVELALEGFSPFPLAQLYYGWLCAPGRDRVLVFAAYRKKFSPEETAEWEQAAHVLPAFLALLGDHPTSPTIRLWTMDGILTAAALDGQGALPVAVLSRHTEEPAGAAQREALLAELRERTGLTSAAVREFAGAARWQRTAGRQGLQLEVSGRADTPGLATSFSKEELEMLDVRDRGFLVEHRKTQRRDQWLWRGFRFCLAGLAVMAAGEIALAAAGGWLKKLQDSMQEHTAEVRKIELAQALSTRIGELAQRRLRPFEMLALANQSRPASIQFERAATAGLDTLEIEARTGNAADVGQYEAALRAAPDVTAVELRDLRSREGMTSFGLTITFKAEALHPEGTK